MAKIPCAPGGNQVGKVQGSMARLPSLSLRNVTAAASGAVCSVLRTARVLSAEKVEEEEAQNSTSAETETATSPPTTSLAATGLPPSPSEHLESSLPTLSPFCNLSKVNPATHADGDLINIGALPTWQIRDTMEIHSASVPAPSTTMASGTTRFVPSTSVLTQTLGRLSLADGPSIHKESRTPMLSVATPAIPVPMFAKELPQDPAALAERLQNQRFTEEALDMARLALRTNETPVGCVLVHNGRVIARGMNATNVSRNGTRHAEYMAISALMSSPPTSVLSPTANVPAGPTPSTINPKRRLSESCSNFPDSPCPAFPNESSDVRLGHLYPYGLKLLPLRMKVPRSIVRECILYVTVEPCVMCASMLRQLGIKKVYFGAVNDKFGGTGGVFSIHANSPPIPPGTTSYSSAAPPRIAGKSPDVVMAAPGIPLWKPMPPGEGDGGNVEPGYPVEGGWGRDEAVGLLRRFYVQENGRAPVPRKKEGRAARLAAIMAQDSDGPLPPELAVHISTLATSTDHDCRETVDDCERNEGRLSTEPQENSPVVY